MIVVDLNCDMGEVLSHVDGGIQEAILPHITSVNIACGGHAGDSYTMRRTIEQARRFGIGIGAHPGYPDRENFGRVELNMPADDVAETVYQQVRTLAEYTEISHVKAHGALYNRSAKDATCAAAIARGVARFSREVVLVGLVGSVMLDVFSEAGFPVAAEGFADRRYEVDGSLRPRSLPDALIEDPEVAADQAVRLARGNRVRTICIHGDTLGAAAIAAAVKASLGQEGIEVRPLLARS